MADTIQIRVVEQGASNVLTSLKTIQTTINTINATKVNISVDTKVLNALARVQNANAKIITSNNNLKIAIEKTKRAAEEHATAEVKLATQMERTATAEEQARRANTQLQTQIEKTATETAKQSTETAKLATQQEKTATQIERTKAKEVELQIQQEKTNTALAKGTTQAETYADTLENKLGTALLNTVTRLGRRYLISALRESIDTMQAVDDELVNISKITGDTVDELGSLEDAAYRVASALGVSADEHLSNTAAFYRAGYREQADELALLADKIEIVSGMTADEAQQFIISADAAYGYAGSVEELTKVMDGAIAIDNNYATTVQKIAEGIGIVAPVASQVHVSIEELTAALGTITSVTQRSGSESARALRALFLNIVGDTKTEIDEGVTWTTGEIAGLQDVLKKYASDVVEAAEATGSVINPMEAIHALNQAMEEGLLTEAELMETVSDIGGKLRSSQLLAIVQNWDVYESMLAEFETSAGNTETKVEAAMDSWSVKTQQLQNAWTEFVSNLVDTGTIKDALDGVIKLVELLNTDAGRAVVAWTGVSAVAIGLVGVVEKLIVSFKTFGAILKVSNPIILGVSVVIAGLAVATSNYSAKVKELSPELQTLSDTLDEVKQSHDEVNKSFDESITKTGAAATVAEKYVKRLEELESQGNSTAESQKEYNSIVNQLNELIPDLSLEIDTQTGYINTQTSAIYDQIDAWKELARQQAVTEKYTALYTQKTNLEIDLQALENALPGYLENYKSAETAWVSGGMENASYSVASNYHAAERVYTDAQNQIAAAKAEIASLNKQIRLLDDYVNSSSSENTSTTSGNYGEPVAAGTVGGKNLPYIDSERTVRWNGKNYEYRDENGNWVNPLKSDGTTTDTSTGTNTGTSTTSKTANETALELIQNTKALEESRLSYLEASGASAEELVEQYKLLQGITHDEAEKLRDIEEEQTGIRSETADTLELSADWWKYQSDIEELLEETAEAEYDVNAALEETVALLKEVNGTILDEQTAAIDEQIDALDAQIDAISEKNEAEEESNKLEEKRLALLEAEEKLRNAQNERTVRVFNSATGQWEWNANQSDVTSAQEAVDEARIALEEAQQEAEDNAAISALEAKKEALEAEKSALKAQYEEQESAWDNLLAQLEEPTKDLAAAFKDLAENGTPEVVESLLNIATSFGISEADIAETLKKFGLESVNGDLGTALSDAGVDVKQFAQELVKTSILNRMMRRSDAWFDASDADRAELEALNEADAATLGLTKGSNGAWYWSDGSLAYQTDTQKSHTSSSSSSTSSGSSTSTSSSSSSGSSTSTSTSSATETVKSNTAVFTSTSGDSYTVTSSKGISWLNSAKAGDTMTGGDGSVWVKNNDGTVSISKNGVTYSGTYDNGGILSGMGGIKATNEDEIVLPPNVARAMLRPQNSSAFSQRLSELGFLYGASGSNSIAPTGTTHNRNSNDHYGDTYNYGNISLSESQAKSMTVYDLARLAKGLSIYS